MHMLTHMHMPCPAVYLFLKLYDLEKYSGTDDILNWVWEAWARGLYLIAVLCRLATLISLGLVGSARLDARLATTERQLPTALEAVFAASHPGLPPTPEAIEAVWGDIKAQQLSVSVPMIERLFKAPACNHTWTGAATTCDGGCNPMWTEAATMCDGG